ncbi:putative secreted signaling factor WNT10 [Penaeus vannamei]|uniref:Protein Wnt n=1 Tax=Penaeus vannamei TaxID=6689 RepID=A0A423SA98_PENVA|nr:putative secreted signaling factor WNT10 [Penaeus vannamei]
MSGSCEVRTCWKAAPDFRRVGDMLKEKYRKAKSAASEVFGNSANTASMYRPVRREISPDSPLLYVERSPTFCEVDGRLDVAGTEGRHCNRNSTGPDSCDSLCCGRGYDQQRQKVSRKCHCRFKWCCHVTCQDCSEEKWISVCKSHCLRSYPFCVSGEPPLIHITLVFKAVLRGRTRPEFRLQNPPPPLRWRTNKPRTLTCSYGSPATKTTEGRSSDLSFETV